MGDLRRIQLFGTCLYIVGSNIWCLWSSSEIEIWNWIDDEFSDFTWFNEETCTSRKMLTAPCSKSEIKYSVSILSIMWQLVFLVKWKRETTTTKIAMSHIHVIEWQKKLHIWHNCFSAWTYTKGEYWDLGCTKIYVFLFLPMSMRQVLSRLILWQLFKIWNKH